MKKLISVILVLSLAVGIFSSVNFSVNAQGSLAVGSIVTFGRYEQDNNLTNGKEPIQWEVMEDCGDGSVILLSKYLLDSQKFDDSIWDYWEDANENNAGYNVTKNGKKYKCTWNNEKNDFDWDGEQCPCSWDNSSLRKWLNTDFCNNSFNQNEKQALTENINENKNNPYYGTKCGSSTKDKVWIFSIDEMGKYYNNNELPLTNESFKPIKNIQKSTTEYAKAKGVTVYDKYKNSEGEYVGGWWLRSFGNCFGSVSYVSCEGTVNYFGNIVCFDGGGICPAVKVKKDALVNSNSKQKTVDKKSSLKAPSKNKYSVKAVKKGKAKITLKKVKGASKLQYRYKLKGKKKWSKAVTVANKKKSYTVKGLKKKKTYLFSIRYKKNNKYSKWSKTKKVKIK